MNMQIEAQCHEGKKKKKKSFDGLLTFCLNKAEQKLMTPLIEMSELSQIKLPSLK